MRAIEDLHTKQGIAKSAAMQYLSAKADYTEKSLDVAKQQRQAQEKAMKHAAATFNERKNKYDQRNQLLAAASEPLDRERLSVEVEEAKAQLDASEHARDNILKQQLQLSSSITAKQTELTTDTKRLAELASASSSSSDVDPEEAVASQLAYSTTLQAEVDTKKQCDVLTEAAFGASRTADLKAGKRAELLQHLRSTEDQQAIMPHIIAHLEHKQVEARLALMQLKKQADAHERGEDVDAVTAEALQTAEATYKSAAELTGERRLDIHALKMRHEAEKEELSKLEEQATTMIADAKGAKAKAEAACEHHQQEQDRLFGEEEQRLASAASQAETQAQKRLQAEANLRLQQGQLSSVSDAVADAKRGVNTVVQKEAIVQGEITAQRADLETAQVELQRAKAADLEGLVVTKDELAVQVADQRLQAEGEQLDGLVKEKKKQVGEVEARAEQQRRALEAVEAARLKLEATNNKTVVHDTQAEVKQIVESATKEAKKDAKPVRIHMHEVPMQYAIKDEMGGKIAITDDLPEISHREELDHQASVKAVAAGQEHEAKLMTQVKERQAEMDQLIKIPDQVQH
eukprot:TRINITY_DN6318_c0_g1_i3.p1 TRINITY_DN6318_c0_g1~~TRINITY_DN6318_c0_g1_i3.p1  ORF type:complete len:575 (+),score=206.72 TRINITY_DN6318_c0_g1_i3:246-1970(+)